VAGRVRRLTAREVEQILRHYGFVCVSQKGSHRKWRNDTKRLQVIVPEHRGQVLPIGTLMSILDNPAIPESEWKD